jgi:hypothetical protein
MNLWRKEVPNPPVSSGVRRMKKFVCSWCVLRELLPSPSSSSFDFSFLDHFGSFLLPWFELWRELTLSTEGNQPIPHELADRVISWSRSQEPVFFRSSFISRDRLEIGCWCLEDIFSTLPRTYLQSFKSIRVVLIEFWPILSWFVLLFLDSAEPPRKTRNLRAKTWNLRAAEPLGKNEEPLHLLAEIMCLGFSSARFEIRLLHWFFKSLKDLFLSILVTSWHGYFGLRNRFLSIEVEYLFFVPQFRSGYVLVCGVPLCS